MDDKNVPARAEQIQMKRYLSFFEQNGFRAVFYSVPE